MMFLDLHWQGLSPTAIARQLGIVPAPGSRAERGMVALQRLQARLARR